MNLTVECNDLKNGDTFPVKYTHRGEEISPEFHLENLSPQGKTIAIILDDIDQPMNHWIIWNIPAMHIIPGNLPGDNVLSCLGNAMQRSKYRGPNPPKGIRHTYQFSFYVLDTELSLKHNASKKQLEKALEGHVLQYGMLSGYYE